MFQFAVLLLRVATQVFSMLERQSLIKEGERRQIVKELDAIARASRVAQRVREDVARKTDTEIDDALRGDFRD